MTDSVTRSFVRVRCVACVAALLGIFAVDGEEVCAQSARLENVARTLSETWRWRVYTREQGLSSNTVTALYQDRQNDVYAATTVGICRFDLWRWHVVENGGALGREAAQFAESPTDLFVSNRRGVWRVLGDGRLEQLRSGQSLHMAAGSFGEVYLIDAKERQHDRIRGGDIAPIDTSSIVPRQSVIYDYKVGPDRRHWLATNLDLYWRDLQHMRWKALESRNSDLDLDRYECRRLYNVSGARSPKRTVSDVVDEDSPPDELWGFFVPRGESRKGRLAYLKDGYWTQLGDDTPFPAVTNILLDSDGVYYLTTENGQLHISLDRHSWIQVARLGLEKVPLAAGLIDTAGFFWFRIKFGGIAMFDPSSRRWTQTPLGSREMFPPVLSLMETQSGDLWVGTDDGVLRYDPNNGVDSPYESAQGVNLRRITGLAEDLDRGGVWVSSSSAFRGVLYYDGNNWIREQRAGIDDYHISRIVQDFLGEVWFLPQDPSADASWVYRSSVHTKNEIVRVDIDGGSYTVQDLARPRESEFWLATKTGLLRGRIQEKSSGDSRFVVERKFMPEDGLRSENIWAIAEGPDGSMWVSYGEPLDVSRIRDDDITNFDQVEGKIWSISVMGDDLWFGTDKGLTRFDGECFYSSRVAGAQRPWGVWPIVPSRTDPGTLLIGSNAQGVWAFRNDDRRRPRVVARDFVSEVARDGHVAFEWIAHDYRTQSEDDQLWYRTRLDSKPWSEFTRETKTTFRGLDGGDHTFEVEVRDLNGNRSRGLSHRFRVGVLGEAQHVGRWAGAIGGGGLVALVAFYTVRRSLSRRRQLVRYRSMFWTSPFPMFVLGGEGRIEDYNGKAPLLLGLDAEDSASLVGRPLQSLPVFAPPEMSEKIKGVLRGEAFVHRNLRWPHGDAEMRVFRVQGYPLINGAGRVDGAVVLLENRTRFAEEESRRERSRRLTSLREVSKVIASDLNYAIADVRKLLGRVGKEPFFEEHPDVLERIQRSETILKSLAAFSGDVDDVPLAEIETRPLMQSILSGSGVAGAPSIRVDFRPGVSVWRVKGERESLAEAFRAIIRNAVEAMPDAGTLTIRIANVRVENDASMLPDGAYVELKVEDTGEGMDPKQCERALDPFYTTKSRTHNHGVGLSLAYGVVRAHQGDLRITSEQGSGTIVSILLPSAHE